MVISFANGIRARARFAEDIKLNLLDQMRNYRLGWSKKKYIAHEIRKEAES